MRWQDVESEVRTIAESIWSTPASPKVEGGIKCDIIIKVKPNYWVMIEVSKRDDLDKLRSDILKLSLVRQGLMGRQIYCECYFITTGNHSSLRETGEEHFVEVHDINSFASKFLGTRNYITERRLSAFGSAVDPDTGLIDPKKYTPISYVDKSGKRFSKDDIAKLLQEKKQVILLGEFGTGKSRCIMEIFDLISQHSSTFAPIAINLRDNWGYQKFNHIIQNHLDSLGLGDFAPNLVRSLRRGNHVLMLDGFDELGVQSWSGDAARLTEIRKKSLEGVRDLLQNCPDNGIILTGREHYFSSDAEMAECLGINLSNLVLIYCPEEFSESEVTDYIRNNTNLQVVPEWMPRKPLICQLLARLDESEVTELNKNANGEIQFFESVFDSICARETRINSLIYKESLKSILLQIAQDSRQKTAADEVITIPEINQIFFDVTGASPIDESAVLLQRLPYLGRVGSGTSDRVFVDEYAKDGLRGLAIAQAFLTMDKKVSQQKWKQPVGIFGARVFSSKISMGQSAQKYAQSCINAGNTQAACDYISSQFLDDESFIDFRNINVFGGAFHRISLIGAKLSNLTLRDCYIHELTVEDCQFDNVHFTNCLISNVVGIGSEAKLPSVFTDCEVEKFHDAMTASRISQLKLTRAQKTLLVLIKKLFFQPGSGRQEDALLRGAESYWDADAADKALSYMESNGIIRKAPGKHGTLFVPSRRHTHRMARIWELQSNCGDELWSRVT